MGTVVSTLAVGAVHILGGGDKDSIKIKCGRRLGLSFLTPSTPHITCFITELLSPRNSLSGGSWKMAKTGLRWG